MHVILSPLDWIRSIFILPSTNVKEAIDKQATLVGFDSAMMAGILNPSPQKEYDAYRHLQLSQYPKGHFRYTL
jgi:hypothetical protein